VVVDRYEKLPKESVYHSHIKGYGKFVPAFN